jgi:hypothetical protein
LDKESRKVVRTPQLESADIKSHFEDLNARIASMARRMKCEAHFDIKVCIRIQSLQQVVDPVLVWVKPIDLGVARKLIPAVLPAAPSLYSWG